MSARFWPSKKIEENLNKRGEFEDVCTFLTKHAHLTKFTVVQAVFNNFKLFNKSRQFQAKRHLRRVFCANFEQQDSCARCFALVLAF